MSRIATMPKQDAFGWIGWAASHRHSALMCSLTVDQYKEGAEEALERLRAVDGTPEAEFNQRWIAETTRKVLNNVGMVTALDILGCDTAAEALEEYPVEIGAASWTGLARA